MKVGRGRSTNSDAREREREGGRCGERQRSSAVVREEGSGGLDGESERRERMILTLADMLAWSRTTIPLPR